MKITNETKVGVFTIVALTVLVLGYTYMQGLRLFSPTNSYYAVYEDVDGLKASNPVLMRGYQIGRVASIDLKPIDDDLKIFVRLDVDGNINVPRNSVAKIINHDLLGAKAIKIERGDAPELASHRDTLTSAREMGLTESFNELLAPVKTRTENLITSVDTVVTALQGIIEAAELEFMFKSMQSAITSLEKTSHRLDTFVTDEATRVDRIFANVESITQNVKENNEAFTNVVNNFSSISDSIVAADIKKTIDQTSATINELDNILKNLSEGEGSAGKLLTDDALYYRLDNAAKSIERLTNNVREQPHRYLNMSLINFRRSSPPEEKKEEEED